MTERIPPVIGPCGKRIYAGKNVAQRLARRVNDSGKERVHPYHCNKCHGWHLGTADYLAQSRAIRRKRASPITA